MNEIPVNTEPASQPESPQLSSEAIGYLVKSAKWGKFLAIFGFVVTGLLVVAGILMNFLLNTVSDDLLPSGLPVPPQVISLIYLVIAAVYLIPVIFLNSYSNKVIRAANNRDSLSLMLAFKNLKNLFVFLGISTIVLLALYVVILAVAGTAAIFAF